MKILITGATSGFGKAMAEKFAAGGHELWITGRRQEKLQSVSKTLSGQYHHDIRITAVDVRKKTEVQLLAKDIQERWGYVDVLINNAGLALGFSGIESGDTDDWDTMIDTNIKGLLYVTR